MLENSRKRVRKSKLEVREGVELEEATVLYMEASNTKVKDEPMIDVGPTMLVGLNKDIMDPFNDVSTPPIDCRPLMQFSVKIEVEECDETGSKASSNTPDNETINDKPIVNDTLETLNYKSLKVLEDTKPVSVTEEATTAVVKIETHAVDSDVITNDMFKEYVTNRYMLLKITDRLLKSEQIADKMLAIEVRNYTGRVLDEPIKDARDMLLVQALDDWQSWYQEHSAVRDSPLLYKCYICGRSWWYMHSFKKHIAHHMMLSQFEVSLETNNDESSLICFQLDRVCVDIELPKTKCDKCGKPADSHAFAYNNPYKCVGCQTTFSTCTQLQMHESLCSWYKKIFFPDESKIHKCSICLFECYKDTNLNEHMIRRHTVRSDVVTTWDVKNCQICSRSFSIPSLHICIKKTNNYGCNYCGRSFQKKLYKENHIVNYNKPVNCMICDKHLTASCMIYTHMLQHTDKFALMYKCIQCFDGRYYPDEFSIKHHTSIVHNRPFEKKFKYLEMVILPKQCLEKSSKTLQPESAPAGHLTIEAPSINTSDSGIAKEDITKSNVFVPSAKYTTTNKMLEIPIDVVVKQEPMDIETLCVTDLAGVKAEPVDGTTQHLQITDITSLQDLIKFKTEPVEEVVAEDLIIVEDKSETITLYSSGNDDSEDDYKMKYTGLKRKKLARYTCVCGYVDIASRMKSHKQHCSITLNKRALRKRLREEKKTQNKTTAAHEVGNNSNADDQQEDLEDYSRDTSDEEWNQGVPLKKNSSKSGIKYTCHCKKEFIGTLASFRHHKKACTVVAKLKMERKALKLTTTFPCTKCHNEFNSMLKYAKHFNKIHCVKKYMCPHCQTMLPSLGKLTNHMSVHVNRNYLKIRLINEAFQGTKCNRCKVCRKPVERKDYFQHWEAHLVLNIESQDCKVEDSDSLPDEDRLVIDTGPAEVQSMYNPELLQRALAWLQSAQGPSADDSKTCVFCARRFSRQHDSKRHVIEHLLLDACAQRVHYKMLRCPICGQGFPRDDRFKLHMREHASLPVYQCDLCGKSFSDSSNFCKHKKVHDLSLLRCNVCDKKFHNRSHLAKHLEMHAKTKPIVCTLCDKVSFTASAHKKHVRCSHERHKTRVLCHICRAPFTRLKDKWDHLWLVHKERKFEADCPLCPEAFRRFADVKAHVRIAHHRNVRVNDESRLVVCW